MQRSAVRNGQMLELGSTVRCCGSASISVVTSTSRRSSRIPVTTTRSFGSLQSGYRLVAAGRLTKL